MARWVAAVLRNIDDNTRFLQLSENGLENLGHVALSYFLVLSLMGLDLSKLASVALPLLVLIALQVLLIGLLSVTLIFKYMGKDHYFINICLKIMSAPELQTENTLALSTQDRVSLKILGFFSRLSLSTLQYLGFLIGSIAAWFPHGPAWVIRRNLKLCFPEQSERWINTTTKQNLIYTAQKMVRVIKL